MSKLAGPRYVVFLHDDGGAGVHRTAELPHHLGYPELWETMKPRFYSGKPDEFALRCLAAQNGLDPDEAWAFMEVGEDMAVEIIKPHIEEHWRAVSLYCDRFAPVAVSGRVVGYLVRERGWV